jgi:hypothetical protein
VFYFGIIHANQLNVVQCVLQLPCQLPKEIVWKVDHKSKAHLTLFPGKEVGSINVRTIHIVFYENVEYTDSGMYIHAYHIHYIFVFRFGIMKIEPILIKEIKLKRVMINKYEFVLLG